MVHIHCAPSYISKESSYVFAGAAYLMYKELDPEMGSLPAS